MFWQNKMDSFNRRLLVGGDGKDNICILSNARYEGIHFI